MLPGVQSRVYNVSFLQLIVLVSCMINDIMPVSFENLVNVGF